jgi:hypothetical protein
MGNTGFEEEKKQVMALMQMERRIQELLEVYCSTQKHKQGY